MRFGLDFLGSKIGVAIYSILLDIKPDPDGMDFT